MFKAIIAVLIVTVVVLIALSAVDHFTGTVTESSTTNTYESEKDSFEVTISGEVKRPGTYLVKEGLFLSDLIESAGGLTSNADEKAFNTSFLLEKKLDFYIAPLFDTGNVCASTPIEKACLNSASKEELLEKTVLTANQADGVISYRQEARFERLEEMKNVTGIGPATFEKCKDYVTLYD